MDGMDGLIYLDHAATTPADPEVVRAMAPYFTEHFGNPSTLYSIGREAKNALEEARESVALAIGANPEEIAFTGGGSEADNFALEGVAFANQSKGRHIITTVIEHHAVLETAVFLEKRGFDVTYVRVDADGLVDPDDIAGAIRPDTILISVMMANNEVGAIQPIAEIGKIAKERRVCFHSDTVQAVGALPISVDELGVDLLAMSAHKLYGPKGVGALYIRKGTKMVSFIHGGGQERKRRAGTENVAGIIGLAKALEIAGREMQSTESRLVLMRDRLISGLLGSIDDIRLNGHPTKRLPNNVNVAIENAEGEAMLLNLDMYGVAASSGSACTSGSLKPSHVLISMGIPPEVAHGSLRFTLGRSSTEAHVDRVLDLLPGIVDKLRAMSPLKAGEM